MLSQHAILLVFHLVKCKAWNLCWTLSLQQRVFFLPSHVDINVHIVVQTQISLFIGVWCSHHFWSVDKPIDYRLIAHVLCHLMCPLSSDPEVNADCTHSDCRQKQSPLFLGKGFIKHLLSTLSGIPCLYQVRHSCQQSGLVLCAILLTRWWKHSWEILVHAYMMESIAAQLLPVSMQ